MTNTNKCEFCDYETKFKSNYNRHIKTCKHRNPDGKHRNPNAKQQSKQLNEVESPKRSDSNDKMEILERDGKDEVDYPSEEEESVSEEEEQSESEEEEDNLKLILRELKKSKSKKGESPLAPFINSGFGTFIGGVACGYVLSNNLHLIPMPLGGLKKNFLPPLDEQQKAMMMKMMMAKQQQSAEPPITSSQAPMPSSLPVLG